MDAFTPVVVAIPMGECPAGGTVIYPVLKAPSVSQGGGFTVISAEFWPKTSTNSGTSWKASLVNGGTLGTVLGGTIAAAAGGTASAFAANTVAALTIITTSNLDKIAAGQYLAVKKIQEGGTSAPDGILVVTYIPGR